MTHNLLYRRAGGRRAYNALRRDRALVRQNTVEQLMHAWGWYTGTWGVQRRIAAALGVSEATVSRDIRAIHLRCAGSLFPGYLGRARLLAHPQRAAGAR